MSREQDAPGVGDIVWDIVAAPKRNQSMDGNPVINPDLYSTWWMGGNPHTQLTNNPSTDKWSAANGKETGSRGY